MIKESDLKDGISAIIPTYKGEKYINKLLDSLINQSIDFNLFEAIFIVNGELDSTPDIIKKYQTANPEVNIILTESEKGVCNARNKGIELASRKYSIFIDDDDFISENYFEELYKFVKPNRIVLGTFYDIDEDTGKVMDSYMTPQLLKNSGIIKNPYNTIKDAIVITTNKIIPRSSYTLSVIGVLLVLLLYGIKVGNSRVYLYTTLEDINSTTSVLQSQLIYIMIAVLLLAIVISFFISRMLSKPITDITTKAKTLADNNFDVDFDESDIYEIDELSNALNYLKEETSKTDEYRRDLMANVSHDLKTPLTMIKAYAEMVRDISYKDKNKREENLNVIINESDRLNVLVNDILELSKIQANASDINKEEFDLVKELKEILTRYDILKEKEGYEIILNTPKKVMVNADKKRISQVLYNLINNAINYTGDDKKVYVNIIDNKKYYHIEIKDTGKGIDKDDLKHIWDKYYKKDKNHKRNVMGTGLGLSIVKNILVKHEFNYGVDSVKDKGSIFYFDIPKE